MTFPVLLNVEVLKVYGPLRSRDGQSDQPVLATTALNPGLSPILTRVGYGYTVP